MDVISERLHPSGGLMSGRAMDGHPLRSYFSVSLIGFSMYSLPGPLLLADEERYDASIAKYSESLYNFDEGNDIENVDVNRDSSTRAVMTPGAFVRRRMR